MYYFTPRSQNFPSLNLFVKEHIYTHTYTHIHTHVKDYSIFQTGHFRGCRILIRICLFSQSQKKSLYTIRSYDMNLERNYHLGEISQIKYRY